MSGDLIRFDLLGCIFRHDDLQIAATTFTLGSSFSYSFTFDLETRKGSQKEYMDQRQDMDEMYEMSSGSKKCFTIKKRDGLCRRNQLVFEKRMCDF
jgi:hypothetical protein